MNIKQLQRQMKKRCPKTYVRVSRRWDFKMIGPVGKLTHKILGHVNPRLVKLARKNEHVIDGPEIEGEVWKLLEKVRRITQRERRL